MIKFNTLQDLDKYGYMSIAYVKIINTVTIINKLQFVQNWKVWLDFFICSRMKAMSELISSSRRVIFGISNFTFSYWSLRINRIYWIKNLLC